MTDMNGRLIGVSRRVMLGSTAGLAGLAWWWLATA